MKMSRLVKLVFECTVRCDPDYADDLGRDIVSDIRNEWSNGVDYLDWRFVKSERVKE